MKLSGSLFTSIFKSVLQTRRSGRLWLAAGILLIAAAVLIPNSTLPLLTLMALVGATASGYIAPSPRSVFFLAIVAAIAAVAVWAGPGKDTQNGVQWLAAALVMISATAGVVHYLRELEERVFEFGWQAEISSEAADLGVFRWYFNTDFVQADAKLRQLLTLPPQGPVFGEDFFQKVHAHDLEKLRADVEAARNGEHDYRSEFRIHDEQGRYRWIAARGRVISDPYTGEMSLAGVNFDITDAKERESLVSKLIDGVGALFSITTPQGVILDLNAFGKEQSGADDWNGRKFWALQLWGQSDDIRNGVKTLVEEAAARNEQTSGEAPFWNEEGEKGWVLLTVTPIDSDFGEPLYLCVCAVDISKRKLAEEYNELLVQELNHRMKNLFSVTNALISLSARYSTSVDEFAEATRSRLTALHAAHNIGTVDIKRRRANLEEIVEVTLKPWRTDPPRIFIDGDSYEVDAGAATAWALIVHELASNSTQRGSLSQPGGTLYASWRDRQDYFEFEWREKFSSKNLEKSPEEFGANIVKKLVDGFLDGSIIRESDESESRVRIEIHK